MKKNIINRIFIFMLTIIISLPCFIINSNYDVSYKTIKNDNINIVDKFNSDTENNEDEINIYFYYLSDDGNNNFVPHRSEGDSFIITVGDVEILVDAGVEKGSSTAIREQMKKHVSDDQKWDYVIVTHADKDHLDGIATDTQESSVFGLFLGESPEMTLGTLIDFDITKDITITEETFPGKEKLFYNADGEFKQDYLLYCKYRDAVIKKGAKYYTASQCVWKKRGLIISPVIGAKDKFNLKGNDITLNILYNYYYDHKFDLNTLHNSADKNNISVCFSIDYRKSDGTYDRMLFTGDLEEFDSTSKYDKIGGETKLLENNQQLNEGVVFYKAGHHGSRTSSSSAFIDAIKPKNVVITAVAGNNSYRHDPNSDDSFPALSVMETLCKYTDKIYIPTIAVYDKNNKKTGVEDYYGEITVRYGKNNGVRVETTKNMSSDTNQPLPITETEWYKRYRRFNIFTFSGYVNNKTNHFGNCTLFKYGQTDILIDCGILSNENQSYIYSYAFKNKVEKICTDNVLDYVVVTSPKSECIQQMVDNSMCGNVIKGIMSDFKIKNIIDFGYVNDSISSSDKSLGTKYQKQKQLCIKDGSNYYNGTSMINKPFEISDKLNFYILDNKYYGQEENSDLSLCVQFNDEKCLFLGNNGIEGQTSIYEINKQQLSDGVVWVNVPSYGQEEAFSKYLFDRLISKNDDITIVSNGILGKNFYGNRPTFTDPVWKILSKAVDRETNKNNVFISNKFNESSGIYTNLYGDITFYIDAKGMANIDYAFEI